MKARVRRRVLFVVALIAAQALGAWGLAAWDVGNHVLMGGSGRWIAVAAMLAFLVLRLTVMLALPSLAAWWAADLLHTAGGAVVARLGRDDKR